MKSAMNRCFVHVLVLMLIGFVFAPRLSYADITVSVVPSYAPSEFSPSWGITGGNNGYEFRALYSLGNGLGTLGDRSDPTSYVIVNTSIVASDIIVSSGSGNGFNSWRGVANPTGVVANELGNQIRFGVVITGGGANPSFRLWDLHFEMLDYGPAHISQGGNFSEQNYGVGTGRYGVYFGADRTLGGWDDIFYDVYNPGTGSELVDLIVFVGVGSSYGAANAPGATNQERLNHVMAQINSVAPFDVRCTYTLYEQNGTTVLSEGAGLVNVAGCYANCDNSTAAPVLNVGDFMCFLNKFAAGDPTANCDQSTMPPVLNILDFSCFLNQFAVGCP